MRVIFALTILFCLNLKATPELPLKFIENHCQKCHNPEKSKGGVDFTKYKTAVDFWKDSKTWETSIELVQSGEMPTKEELSEDQISYFSESIAKVLDAENFSVDDWYGRSVLRRLSAVEIENSLSDISGVKLDIAKNFPIDSGGGEGFANNADTMHLTPVFFEKLSLAAEKFAAHAEFDPFDGIIFNNKFKKPLTNEQYYQAQKLNKDDFYTVRTAKMIRHEINQKGILHKYIDAVGDLMLRQKRTDLRAIRLKAIENDLVPGVIWMWTEFLADIEKTIKRRKKMSFWTRRTFGPFSKALKNKISDEQEISAVIEQTKEKLKFFTQTKRSIYKKNFSRYMQVKGKSPLRITIAPSNDGAEFDYVNMHDAHFILKSGKKVYLKDLTPQNIQGSVHLNLNGAGENPKALYGQNKVINIGFKAPAQAFFNVPENAVRFKFGLHMDAKSQDKGYVQVLVDQKESVEIPDDIVDEGYLYMGAGLLAGKYRGQLENMQLYMQARFYPSKDFVELSLNEEEKLEKKLLKEKYSWAWELNNYDDSAFVRKFKLKNMPTPETIGSYSKKVQYSYKKHVDNNNYFKNKLRKNVSSALKEFSLKLYRKPIQQTELDQWLELFSKEYEMSGQLQDTIQSLVVSMVLHPSFIYRFESQDKADVNGYELASRISYFLWSSTPDNQLLELAETNKISELSVLEKQIDRMLKDSKSSRLGKEFFMTWLHTDKIKKDKIPNKDVFPEYNNSLRDLMITEVKEFTNDLIKNDQSISSLISADYSFVNEDLAKFYGIEGIEGKQFQKVDMKEHSRGGILGMGAVHVATSYPERTSPVLRGQWILETLIGAPVPPPPVDVEIPEEVLIDKNLTVKEKLAKHREVSSCAICHDRIDPIGFSMENFDGIGRWRTQENGLNIDTLGELKNGTQLTGINGLKEHLSTTGQEDFVEHFTGKLLGFGLGRGLEYPDRAIVRNATDRAKQENYKFSEIVKGLVMSPAFLKL